MENLLLKITWNTMPECTVVHKVWLINLIMNKIELKFQMDTGSSCEGRRMEQTNMKAGETLL